MNAAANIAATAATVYADEDDDDGDNEGWEDEPDDTLDLALGSTKSELMGWAEGGSSRQRDDETQAYLLDFFMRADNENIAGFQNWCSMLSDDEKRKVKEAAAQ
jgi:hypothetical protein